MRVTEFTTDVKERIRQIATRFRDEMEKEIPPTRFNTYAGKCDQYSMQLVKYLRRYKIAARFVMGEYEVTNIRDIRRIHPSLDWDNQYSLLDGHAWVVANNYFIVDVTADQFHPRNPIEHRVMVIDPSEEEYHYHEP